MKTAAEFLVKEARKSQRNLDGVQRSVEGLDSRLDATTKILNQLKRRRA
jgi:uncharacterized protein YoxC